MNTRLYEMYLLGLKKGYFNKRSLKQEYMVVLNKCPHDFEQELYNLCIDKGCDFNPDEMFEMEEFQKAKEVFDVI